MDSKAMKSKLSAKDQLAMKGLSECKALESNIRRIQVRDIVKEVKDHLKAYSSAGIDIDWSAVSISSLNKFACKLDSLIKFSCSRRILQDGKLGSGDFTSRFVL
ncbi:hypothetical protein Tco_0204535 [Tanacetum coccineum]